MYEQRSLTRSRAPPPSARAFSRPEGATRPSATACSQSPRARTMCGTCLAQGPSLAPSPQAVCWGLASEGLTAAEAPQAAPKEGLGGGGAGVVLPQTLPRSTAGVPPGCHLCGGPTARVPALSRGCAQQRGP